MALSSAVTDRLLELIGDANGHERLADYRLALMEALARAVPSAYVSYNEVGEVGVWARSRPELPDGAQAQWAALAHEHPVLAHIRRTRDGRPRRISDFVSARAFEATRLHREFYAPLGISTQVAFTLPATAPVVVGIALSRGAEDFTDEEVELLDRARPHLIGAYRTTQAFEALHAAVASAALTVDRLRALGLTERQAEAVRWIALGRSGPDAARAMGLSPRTVAKHLQLAYAKLGVRSQSEAAALAWTATSNPRSH